MSANPGPPFAPTTRSGLTIHERVLLYGGIDAGKSRALCTIAKWHQKRGSDAVFYILSNDMAWEHTLGPQGEFEDLENLVIEPVNEMAEYLDHAKQIRKKMRSHDWFTVDLLNGAWEAAQDEYATRVFGDDLSGYWLTEKAKAGSTDDFPIGGWEWGPINKRYRDLANTNLLRMPGHVLCMSGESGLREASKRSGKGGEDAKTLETFGRLGRKPAGQKDDPHRFHTVIHMAQNQVKGGGWLMTTARDRERPKMEGVKVGNFMMDYLVRVAGWKP